MSTDYQFEDETITIRQLLCKLPEPPMTVKLGFEGVEKGFTINLNGNRLRVFTLEADGDSMARVAMCRFGSTRPEDEILPMLAKHFGSKIVALDDYEEFHPDGTRLGGDT